MRYRSLVVLALLVAGAASACVPRAVAADAGGQSAPRPAAVPVYLADRGPARVRTWYYYGLNGTNVNVPANVMAFYADYVEDDGYTAAHAQAFKLAGGRYAGAYTDPAYVPYCLPPFSPPAGRCDGPIGALVHDEGAWFHGRDGTRVRRYEDEHFHYTEALNPLSPDAKRAWRAMTAAIVAKAPALDFFFSDDSGGPMRAGDMSPQSSEFYGFNDAGVEITSEDVFRDAWIAYLAQAVRPLFINGNDPITGLPAYGGAFLRQPNVWGAVHEGCFRGESGLQTERRDRWRSYEASLLANTELHKLAVCFMIGTPTVSSRLYALASWWLSYDPQWSVMAPIDPVPGGSAILPETELVPAYPLQTVRRSIDELRRDSGVYVREFARCYLRGRPIAACAVFVNPSLRPMQMPHDAARYDRILVLDDRDLLSGGHVSWNHEVPTVIPPATGIVLFGG